MAVEIMVLEGVETVLVGEPVIIVAVCVTVGVAVGVAVEGVTGSQWGRIKTSLMPSSRIGVLQENCVKSVPSLFCTPTVALTPPPSTWV